MTAFASGWYVAHDRPWLADPRVNMRQHLLVAGTWLMTHNALCAVASCRWHWQQTGC